MTLTAPAPHENCEKRSEEKKKKMARQRNTSFGGLRFAESTGSGVASGQQPALLPESVCWLVSGPPADGAGVAAF
jgi:hypothetical protein